MADDPVTALSEEELAEGIGDALATDYFLLTQDFNDEQRDYLKRTREFVHADVLPVINEYWDKAEFPWPMVKKLADTGLVGAGIKGYGCPEVDEMTAGLIIMELSRGDGSLGTFYAVHVGLAMKSIEMLGSPEQKERYLPAMANLDLIGAFALTEPNHGSDSVALETTATRDGDSYVLNGEKKWIGNGTIADVVVVWARDTEDDQVKGFIVEKGTPGYSANVIEGKGSLRAVWQAEIELKDVRVPVDNKLAGSKSFKDTAAVLTTTRAACAWMALGHAVAGYDAALTYAKRRVQFGKTLVHFQLIQDRLVKMLAKVTAMQLYCIRVTELALRDSFSPTLAGLAKAHNTTAAREVLAEARDLLGGNGILLDFHVIRHMADIEAVHTFEGTETVQTLIVGRDITGVSAFK